MSEFTNNYLSIPVSAWEIDRSRILDFQSCPRKRFFGYHYNGQGLQKVSKSLPLVFGDAFHQAAEIFLPGGDVEVAVQKAINFLNLTFSVNGVDLGDERATAYGIEEQKAIAEGLIRAWCIYKRDEFLSNFEVLEVEQEGRAHLTTNYSSSPVPGSEPREFEGGYASEVREVHDDSLVLMFRPDALVREKFSGDLYVVSWKTASTFGQYTINSINSDMQSMSEVWGVTQDHACSICSGSGSVDSGGSTPWGEWIEIKCGACNGTGRELGGISVEGVLYLFAVKGQRKMDDYLGFKVQNTPLAYGWVRKGVTEDEDEWAWQYGWATEEINSKTGKYVQTKLGKGFRKVPIWSDYPGGVKQWIEDLYNHRISPRHIDPFETIFPQMMPISRRVDEIESWKRQTISNEGRVRERVRVVMADSSDEIVDREFPQHTARCFDYQSKCPFFECCFTPAIKADPLASGLYRIRESNHPEKGDVE